VFFQQKGSHVIQPQAASNANNMPIRAIIGKVRGDGEQRFAIAYLQKGVTVPGIKEGESITFSLKCWQGQSEPTKEQVVLLEGIELFRQGWRAQCARPIVPSHKPQAEVQP
jgi:hypothetical protein